MPTGSTAGRSLSACRSSYPSPSSPIDGDGVDAADAERGEVVDDGAGRAGVAADPHHLVGDLAGLNRRFIERGFDVEIAIEEEVAEHADGALGDG